MLLITNSWQTIIQKVELVVKIRLIVNLNSNKLKKHVSSHVRPRVKFKKKQNDALILLDRGESIFLTGPGGVGKTAVLKSFIANSNKRVAVTSTTGASAVILNGSTLHSFLGIGHGRTLGLVLSWTGYCSR